MTQPDISEGWAANEIVTAQKLNRYTKDMFDWLLSEAAERTYTPVLTASSSNPTLGTGSSQVGRYRYNPLTGLVHVRARILFGSSGVSAGDGTYFVSLPIPPRRTVNSSLLGNADVIGQGAVRDNSTAANNRTVSVMTTDSATGDVVQFIIQDGGGNVTHNSPFSWDAGDRVIFSAFYAAEP